MRQFLVSAGRIFNNRGLYALRRPGMEPTRGVTQTSTKDHPASEPKMSNWEHTKEKITNTGKVGFGSDTKPVEMPIVERTRIKGADRQGTQHQKMESMSSNQEQLLRDAASGKSNQASGQSKETQDLAEKQRRADERAAKYPNMPKEAVQQGTSKGKEHHENDKITEVINEEHGIPEVGEKKTKNQSPQSTGLHEQHGARLAGDDMVNRHQPKMRFDPAKSAAENANMSSEQRGKSSLNIKNTADHQKMDSMEKGQNQDRNVDAMNKDRPDSASAGFLREGQGSDAKRAKTEGKEEANAAGRAFQPQMRGDFGILSGSPVGGIKNPEKRPKADQKDAKH